jgi:hypothetical protein
MAPIANLRRATIFVNTAIAAQELYTRCREEAVKSLGYPSASKLLDLSPDEAAKDSGNSTENGASTKSSEQ